MKVNTGPEATNLLLNPSFAGSGTAANGYSTYASGATGTNSVSGNAQTVTATALTSANKRYGTIKWDEMAVIDVPTDGIIYMSVDVDTTGLDTDTYAYIYLEELAGGSVQHYRGQTGHVGDTNITMSLPSRASLTDTIRNVLFCISTSESSWSGTSTVVFTNAILCVLDAGATPPLWFDGNSPDCSWAGTADASTSTKPIFQTAVKKFYNGTTWNVA